MLLLKCLICDIFLYVHEFLSIYLVIYLSTIMYQLSINFSFNLFGINHRNLLINLFSNLNVFEFYFYYKAFHTQI